MEEEISNFIKVWVAAWISLCYCYCAGKLVQNTGRRLAAVLPVVALFLFLPLQLKSAHLTGTTAFFLAWLANFKLLMFAFNIGPLSDPSISLPKFVTVGCLPIQFQKSGGENAGKVRNSRKSCWNYAVKATLLGLVLKIYDYENSLHPSIMISLYSLHIYLCLEITLYISAAIAAGLHGVELEPQFNEPFLSTSLQNLWGRRWNLMVTRTLWPAIYLPVRGWATRVVGRQAAFVPAVMATFVVSGLMHELMSFYFGRVTPTWETTCFFLVNGACLAGEIAVKKVVNGRWRLPGLVGAVLTHGILIATSVWLFFPQLLRCRAHEVARGEIAAVGEFVTDAYRALI